MKKSLLLLLAAASFSTAQAQKAGDVFIYGGIGYRSEKINVGGIKTDLRRRLQIFPGIGYQFSKNWGAGVQLNYDITKTGATSATEETNYSLAPGLFTRYTQPLSSMFFVFGQFNASYIHINRSAAGSTTSVKANGFDLSVMPAVGINLSKCISVIGTFGSVGYRYAAGDGFDRKEQVFDASIGNEFALTVQFNLGRHRRMRPRREPMTETRNMDRYRDDRMDDDREEAAPVRRRRMDDDRDEAPVRRRRVDRDDY